MSRGCVCVGGGGGGGDACVRVCMRARVCCKFVTGERAGVLQRSTIFVCDYCVVRVTY